MYPYMILNSMPKAGTNLLINVFKLIGYRNPKLSIDRKLGNYKLINSVANIFYNHYIDVGIVSPQKINRLYFNFLLSAAKLLPPIYIPAHCLYNSDTSNIFSDKKYKMVCIIRDPRDVIVSHYNYVLKNTNHFLHEYYKAFEDRKQCLDFIIEGGNIDSQLKILSITERYINFFKWHTETLSLFIRFEDLIGVNGGGSDIQQKKIVSSILEFIEYEDDHRKVIESISPKIFSKKVHTFRKGQIGDWVHWLSQDQSRYITSRLNAIYKDFHYC